MGQEEEQKLREKAFADFQVNEKLMGLAHPDCLFMHCLPAHRGEEISETMLDHKNAVVWDEAENRLHAQKALMEFLLNENLKKSLISNSKNSIVKVLFFYFYKIPIPLIYYFKNFYDVAQYINSLYFNCHT